MRDVREQGSERDHHLDTELAGKVDDHVGEGLPAEVRLDPEEQYGVAIEIWDRRVVESIFRPVDVPRLAVDEGDVRAGRLEVEEVLRLDVGEAVRIPDLGEVAARERGALAAVVPTAKSSDQNRCAQGGPVENAEFVSDRRSLRSAGRTASQGQPCRPRPWPPGRRVRARAPTGDAFATAALRAPSGRAAGRTRRHRA